MAQDAPPVDLKTVLETLKQSKEKRATSEKTNLAKVTQDFRAAAANNATAINFYELAYAATKFDGKAREHADFQEWKKNEADKLKSDAMQNAVRLHLNYLTISLQRASGATMQQLEQSLIAHIAALNAAGAGDTEARYRRDKAKEMKDAGIKAAKGDGARMQTFWDQEITKQTISGSIFVQWYGAQKLFSNMKEWETNPFSVDGIYTQTLLPYFRQNKDPRALAYWDEKIQHEAQVVSNTSLAFKIDQFNSIRRPALLWQKATDMIAIGQRNRGISEMVNLIKNFPDHPELASWITTVEGMVAAPAPAASAAATGTAPAAPAPQ